MDYCPAMQTLTTHSFVVKDHLLEGQKVGEREQHVKYLLTNLIFVRPVRSGRQGGGERIQHKSSHISVTKLPKRSGETVHSNKCYLDSLLI